MKEHTMYKKQILSALLISSAAFAAYSETATNEVATAAENQIIVSATRIDQPIEQIGSSVEVITAEQIEQSKSATMLDALELVPGLNIRRSGASSLKANISLRGAPPEATLVLIDGVSVYDQSHMSGFSSFDLGAMTADNIERIEVLKGAQSVLYGSSAMSGAINIVTKKGSGDPKASLFAEFGSKNTWHTGASISGGDDKVNFSASASVMDRQGESATDADPSNDKDGYENKTAQAKVGFTPVEGTEIEVFATYLKATGDYDDNPTSSWGVGSGEGIYQEQEQVIAGTSIKTLLLDGSWEPKLSVSLNQLDRDESQYNTWYDSQTAKVDLQNALYLSDQHTLILGTDWYEDTYETDGISKGDLDNTGLYAMYQLALADQWFTSFGLRYDNHSVFGDETTYQITTAYLIEETGTRLHSSLGTGFKAPNSYQLYYSWGGNADLKAQTSTSWDIGIDQEITKQVKAGITYFHTDYDNLIAWDDNGTEYDWSDDGYNNISNMKSQGIETYAEYAPSEKLRIKLSYTYTDNDSKDGEDEYYIPNHETGLLINYAATEKWNINLNGQRVTDTGSSDSYTLINAASSYQLKKNVQVYTRLSNLLNEDYELSTGYNEDGFGLYAGVKIDL
jgi:vitamin B12 transporter